MHDLVSEHVERLQDVPTTCSLLTSGEKLLSPAAAAKASSVPGHRAAPHLNGSTIFRHIVKGVRAANGEVIRQEAVRAGLRWLTSVQTIARFYARLTAAELRAPEAAPAASPTPRQRTRQQEAASKQLDALLAQGGVASLRPHER